MTPILSLQGGKPGKFWYIDLGLLIYLISHREGEGMFLCMGAIERGHLFFCGFFLLSKDHLHLVYHSLRGKTYMYVCCCHWDFCKTQSELVLAYDAIFLTVKFSSDWKNRAKVKDLCSPHFTAFFSWVDVQWALNLLSSPHFLYSQIALALIPHVNIWNTLGTLP